MECSLALCSGLTMYFTRTGREVSNTVEPRYNEVLGTVKITLLYPWDRENYLVISG